MTATHSCCTGCGSTRSHCGGRGRTRRASTTRCTQWRRTSARWRWLRGLLREDGSPWSSELLSSRWVDTTCLCNLQIKWTHRFVSSPVQFCLTFLCRYVCKKCTFTKDIHVWYMYTRVLKISKLDVQCTLSCTCTGQFVNETTYSFKVPYTNALFYLETVANCHKYFSYCKAVMLWLSRMLYQSLMQFFL